MCVCVYALVCTFICKPVYVLEKEVVRVFFFLFSNQFLLSQRSILRDVTRVRSCARVRVYVCVRVCACVRVGLIRVRMDNEMRACLGAGLVICWFYYNSLYENTFSHRDLEPVNGMQPVYIDSMKTKVGDMFVCCCCCVVVLFCLFVCFFGGGGGESGLLSSLCTCCSAASPPEAWLPQLMCCVHTSKSQTASVPEPAPGTQTPSVRGVPSCRHHSCAGMLARHKPRVALSRVRRDPVELGSGL